MSGNGHDPDYTFADFAKNDFYQKVNEHLVDSTLQLRESAPQSPIHRALDLACGTGAVTAVLVDRLRKLREPVEVIAVDPSESALEKARRLVGNAAASCGARRRPFPMLRPVSTSCSSATPSTSCPTRTKFSMRRGGR